MACKRPGTVDVIEVEYPIFELDGVGCDDVMICFLRVSTRARITTIAAR